MLLVQAFSSFTSAFVALNIEPQWLSQRIGIVHHTRKSIFWSMWYYLTKCTSIQAILFIMVYLMSYFSWNKIPSGKNRFIDPQVAVQLHLHSATSAKHANEGRIH